LVGGSDAALIPHMVEHYRALGVDSFQIIRHAETTDSPGYRESEEFMRQCGLTFFHTHVGPFDGDLHQRLMRYAMDEHPGDWYIPQDSDEFHVYDRPLPELIALCERHGYDYIGGCFLDRIGPGGSIPDVGTGSLWERFPLAGSLSAGLLRAIPFKVGLARGELNLFSGQHGTVMGRGLPPAQSYIQIHHFKWTASAVERLTERARRLDSDGRRNSHAAIIRECRRFVSHVEEHGGTIDVADPRLRMHPAGRSYGDHPQWSEIAQEAQRWQGMMAW
jgi:hypothetical protein